MCRGVKPAATDFGVRKPVPGLAAEGVERMHLHDVTGTSPVDHYRLPGIAQAVIVHDVLVGGTVAVVSLRQDPVEGGVIRR